MLAGQGWPRPVRPRALRRERAGAGRGSQPGRAFRKAASCVAAYASASAKNGSAVMSERWKRPAGTNSL